MDVMHVRTEPLGGSTLAATIRYEEPRLRPYRHVSMTFGCSMTTADASGRGAVACFRLVFLEGSVWDVGRIASTLELRHSHDPVRAFVATGMSRFEGVVALRETPRPTAAADDEGSTWADLSIDDSGRPRRDAFELVTR